VRIALWFGLLGAPLAWTAELVAGYFLEDAECSRGSAHWGIGGTPSQAALFAVTAVIAAAAGLAALASWREVRRGRLGDPRGRIQFMVHSGIVLSAFFLLAVLLTGSGVVALDSCAR
jgi:hypothetical protein